MGRVTATTTVTCEDQDPIISTQLHPIAWMVTPLEGVRFSDDGRRLSGTLTTGEGQAVVIDFVAEKE